MEKLPSEILRKICASVGAEAAPTEYAVLEADRDDAGCLEHVHPHVRWAHMRARGWRLVRVVQQGPGHDATHEPRFWCHWAR